MYHRDRRTREKTICDSCSHHIRHILSLNPGEANRLRLSNGPKTTAAGPNSPQPGYNPGPSIPPAPLRQAPHNGFLALLCGTCETMEVHGIWFLTHYEIDPPLDRTVWEQFPFSSCTCKNKLGIPGYVGPRMCRAHTERVWAELERKRDDNDRRLRSIEWKKGILVRAHPRTRAGRRTNGFYRACRVSLSSFLGSYRVEC